MNKLEQKLVVELTAPPNVRWWHRNIARQGFSITGYSDYDPKRQNHLRGNQGRTPEKR